LQHVSLAVTTVVKESSGYTLKQCDIIMPFVSFNIRRSQFKKRIVGFGDVYDLLLVGWAVPQYGDSKVFRSIDACVPDCTASDPSIR
jgi:hypothetical protein